MLECFIIQFESFEMEDDGGGQSTDADALIVISLLLTMITFETRHQLHRHEALERRKQISFAFDLKRDGIESLGSLTKRTTAT